jgi:hypothetical protein
VWRLLPRAAPSSPSPHPPLPPAISFPPHHTPPPPPLYPPPPPPSPLCSLTQCAAPGCAKMLRMGIEFVVYNCAVHAEGAVVLEGVAPTLEAGHALLEKLTHRSRSTTRGNGAQSHSYVCACRASVGGLRSAAEYQQRVESASASAAAASTYFPSSAQSKESRAEARGKGLGHAPSMQLQADCQTGAFVRRIKYGPLTGQFGCATACATPSPGSLCPRCPRRAP